MESQDEEELEVELISAEDIVTDDMICESILSSCA